MKKFEYKVFDKEVSYMGQRRQLEEFLNTLGQDGWELISITHMPTQSEQYVRGIAKREIAEQVVLNEQFKTVDDIWGEYNTCHFQTKVKG